MIFFIFSCTNTFSSSVNSPTRELLNSNSIEASQEKIEHAVKVKDINLLSNLNDFKDVPVMELAIKEGDALFIKELSKLVLVESKNPGFSLREIKINRNTFYPPQNIDEVIAAARNGNLDLIDYWLSSEYKDEISYSLDYSGTTVWHALVDWGEFNVRGLLRKHVNIIAFNIVDSNGYNILLRATALDNEPLVRFLITNLLTDGVNYLTLHALMPNIRDDILHVSARHNSISVFSYIFNTLWRRINSGARLVANRYFENRHLEYFFNSRPKDRDLLMQNFNQDPEQQGTPLHVAIYNRSLSIVDFITDFERHRERHLSSNTPNRSGYLPISIALSRREDNLRDRRAIIDSLLRVSHLKASSAYVDGNTIVPINAGALSPNLLSRFAMDSRVDLNAKNGNSETPLIFMASIPGASRSILELIAAARSRNISLDLEATDSNGLNALEVAEKNGNEEEYLVLLTQFTSL